MTRFCCGSVGRVSLLWKAKGMLTSGDAHLTARMRPLQRPKWSKPQLEIDYKVCSSASLMQGGANFGTDGFHSCSSLVCWQHSGTGQLL